MRGFSLIEMAVVLFIVVLLLGSLLVPFATQVEQRRIAETRQAMEEIKEALIGFAIVYGRLPCPAQSATVGTEQPQPCAVHEGFLPWGTLGLAKADAWGHLYRYAVTPEFSDAAFSLTTPTTLTIQTRNDAGSLVPLLAANALPAVVISHGTNGYGGTNENGTAAAPATSTDETTNATAANNFVSRTLAGPNTPAGEFDDIVVWLSPNILFNRMVAAQRLP
jgi:prepilin-type N-terminal cleavage/methylation domain-containing protein